MITTLPIWIIDSTCTHCAHPLALSRKVRAYQLEELEEP
jgi:hypothetical protein